MTSLQVVFDGPLPPCCLLLSPHKRNKDHESWHDNHGWSTISFQRQVFTETGLCLCPLPEAQLKLLQPGCAKMPSKISRKHLILQILSILWYLSCILLMCFCGRYHGNEASPTQTTNKPVHWPIIGNLRQINVTSHQGIRTSRHILRPLVRFHEVQPAN